MNEIRFWTDGTIATSSCYIWPRSPMFPDHQYTILWKSGLNELMDMLGVKPRAINAVMDDFGNLRRVS